MDNLIFSVTLRVGQGMVIKKFRLPEGATEFCPTLGNQKILVTLVWQLKIFNRHKNGRLKTLR